MIHKAEIKDLSVLARLGCRLWPGHGEEEMEKDMAEILAQPDAAFFLAFA